MSAVRPLHPILYRDLIRTALVEDLGRGGDLTSDAIIPPGQTAVARVVARREGRLAGVGVAAGVFTELDPEVEVELETSDGDDAPRGAVLMTVRGSARTILVGERTALNLLGRLCGVATTTRSYSRAIEGTGARVVCTRKTTPGLRALEKYAVRCGGGSNHRFGLDDAVLIKDNHVALAGGVIPAVQRARASVGHTVMVEVEVDTLEQLDQALSTDVDAVLLDNMSLAELTEAVAMVGGRVVTEASGGITLETAAAVAATGVDLLSVGALTHSAPTLDVALDVEM